MMATREEYTSCMRPYITGTGKSPEQRKLDFCIGAKICSGKAKTSEEAKKLCDEAASIPKPVKVAKGRKVCQLGDLEAISLCVTENINLTGLTTKNIQETFTEALKKCTGIKAKRITSAKKALEELDPQQLKALEIIAQLAKEGESRQW